MIRIDVHHHFNFQRPDEDLTKLVKQILTQTTKMAATIEQFESALNRIDTATTNIAQQLRDLKEQIANQGLPAELEQQVLTRLETSATQLEAVGTSVENPVPNPEG
jgi:septal ring factor EnvC (AmiA/AmiB activator)